MFRKMLNESARIFGEAPRRISLWNRLTYLRVPRPEWIYQEPIDDLEKLFVNLPKLWREGIVVWGHIVQANSLLFQPGKDNCPGELVFCVDERSPIGPRELSQIAESLFALKHTEPDDPKERRIADHLTNQRTRLFGAPVPPSISPQVMCRLSTTFFCRKHIPGGRLSCPLLPVVALPVKPHLVIPLPGRFWSDSLRDWWDEIANST